MSFELVFVVLVLTLKKCFSVPANWKCSESVYNSSLSCNCNCGAWDPDCNSTNSSIPLVGCGPFGIRCDSNGNCIFPDTPPPQWICNPEWYGKDDWCDCGCGAYDPDCEDSQKILFGCTADSNWCSMEGNCISDPLAHWECSLSSYNDSSVCDCDCGVYDIDCNNDTLPMNKPNTIGSATSNGQCIPDSWTCLNSKFSSGGSCDCNCGVHDPDCDTSTSIYGCPIKINNPLLRCTDGKCVYANYDSDDGGGGGLSTELLVTFISVGSITPFIILFFLIFCFFVIFVFICCFCCSCCCMILFFICSGTPSVLFFCGFKKGIKAEEEQEIMDDEELKKIDDNLQKEEDNNIKKDVEEEEEKEEEEIKIEKIKSSSSGASEEEGEKEKDEEIIINEERNEVFDVGMEISMDEYSSSSSSSSSSSTKEKKEMEKDVDDVPEIEEEIIFGSLKQQPVEIVI